MADAGGGVADIGGGAVLGLELCVLPGLLIAPGVVPIPVLLSGGQLMLEVPALGFTPAAVVAWLRSVGVPVVPSMQGLISGKAPGVDAGPGVAVGAFPGRVPAPCTPGWLPVCALVAWARARPASARVKVAISSSFRMRVSP